MNISSYTRTSRIITWALFSVAVFFLGFATLSAQPFQLLGYQATEVMPDSSEVGLREVSPLGDAGGIAVPASGGSTPGYQSSYQSSYPGATISAGNCTIELEESTCNSSMTWNFTNISSSQQVRVRNTTTNTTYISNSQGGTGQYPINHGSNTIAAQLGSWSTLASNTATGSCDTSQEIDFIGGQCMPIAPDVDFSVVINNTEYDIPTVVVVPNDTVAITWDTDGTTCEAVGAATGVSGTSGTVTQDLGAFTLGETRTYGVRCRRTIDGVDSAWTTVTAQVAMSDADLSLAVDPTIVRAGNTTEFTWTATRTEEPTDATNLSGVFPMTCSVIGAFPETSNPFNIASFATGNGVASNSVQSTEVFNFFRSTFRCDEPVTGTRREATAEIEVVPGVQEI